MSVYRIDTYDAGSPAWHQQRQTALGGSEIAAVLGLSPWESAFSLWHKKAGHHLSEDGNASTEWGTRLEPAILDKWCEGRTEAPLTRRTYLRDDWMLASPDALIETGTGTEVVEIKTAHDADDWGRPGTDEIPPYYLTQTRWYLGVLGLDVAHLAVLIGGSDYREYRIEQNAEDWALMVREGKSFMDSLTRGDRPDIDAHSRTYQAIRELHPDIDPEHIEINPDIAGEYMASRIALKAEESRHQEAASRLLDAMGSAKHADLDGVRFAYRTARRKADGSPGTPYVQADKATFKQLTAKDAA